MSAVHLDNLRLVLCLVADEEVIEHFPAAVRYLQVGLVDEPVEVILVVPEHPRARSLVSGPTTVVTHKKLPWPFDFLSQRYVVSEVKQKIQEVQNNASVIVHGLSLSSAPLASAIATAVGSDLVLNVASTTALHDPEMMKWMNNASALITPADAIRDAVVTSRLGAKPAEVIHLGVAAESSPAGFRAPDHCPSLIYSGALTADSGVDILFRATRKVLRRHQELLLFILGKGPSETDLRNMAQAMGIAGNVTFPGRLEHLRSPMKSADIFCLPRVLPVFREEPVHALAVGLAVVSADGAYCDGLVHKQNAMLFPDQDHNSLADQINYLLDNRDSARAMAATGQSFARSNHSVSGMVKGHIDVYRKLIRRERTYSLNADS